MNTHEYFLKIVQFLDPHFEDFGINEPAPDADLFAYESEIGIELPAEVRALYRTANGERRTADPQGFIGLFCGYEFLSLSESLSCIRQWEDIRRSWREHPELTPEVFKSEPPNAVQNILSDPLWIPFAGLASGNHLAIDLHPGPAGNVGQIINYGPDDQVHFVIGKNMTQFFEFVLESYAHGKLHPKLDSADVQLYDFLNSR